MYDTISSGSETKVGIDDEGIDELIVPYIVPVRSVR
jgi:hypothetical protein